MTTPMFRDRKVNLQLLYDQQMYDNFSVFDMAKAMAGAIRRRGIRRLAHNALVRGSEFIRGRFSRVLRRIGH